MVVGAALVFLGGPLLFLNPPQCPFAYTQEQVDVSGCIIGANIGLPMFLFAGLLAWVAVTVALVVMAARGRR